MSTLDLLFLSKTLKIRTCPLQAQVVVFISTNLECVFSEMMSPTSSISINSFNIHNPSYYLIALALLHFLQKSCMYINGIYQGVRWHLLKFFSQFHNLSAQSPYQVKSFNQFYIRQSLSNNSPKTRSNKSPSSCACSNTSSR